MWRKARHGPGRQALAALLGYVLALHLILAGLTTATRAAQDFGPEALLNPHALCLAGLGSDDPSGDRPNPSNTADHDPCCTLDCSGITLLTPTAFAPVSYVATTAMVIPATSDFGARPSTAPPGSGQGPRAPPSFLV